MDLGALFLAVSLEQTIPPRLLESLCWIESAHNPQAVSPKDGGSPSIGICQVKEKTCRWLGIKGNLLDAKTNVKCAGVYLAKQFRRYKSWPRAVCAYNKGRSDSTGWNRYTRKVFREWKLRRR